MYFHLFNELVSKLFFSHDVLFFRCSLEGEKIEAKLENVHKKKMKLVKNYV